MPNHLEHLNSIQFTPLTVHLLRRIAAAMAAEKAQRLRHRQSRAAHSGCCHMCRQAAEPKSVRAMTAQEQLCTQKRGLGTAGLAPAPAPALAKAFAAGSRRGLAVAKGGIEDA